MARRELKLIVMKVNLHLQLLNHINKHYNNNSYQLQEGKFINREEYKLSKWTQIKNNKKSTSTKT